MELQEVLATLRGRTAESGKPVLRLSPNGEKIIDGLIIRHVSSVREVKLADGRSLSAQSLKLMSLDVDGGSPIYVQFTSWFRPGGESPLNGALPGGRATFLGNFSLTLGEEFHIEATGELRQELKVARAQGDENRLEVLISPPQGEKRTKVSTGLTPAEILARLEEL